MKIEINRRTFMKAAALGGAATACAGGLQILATADENPAPATGAPAAPSSAPPAPSVPLAPPDKQPSGLLIPQPPKRTVGWAIVGLGELALEEILPAFSQAHLSRPVALVSGHPDKARKVAEAYGIAPEAIHSYENYERLAEDPRVEVIYIVLPNSMHADFTIRGLHAGKHVLCEKPMAPTVPECERMIAASRETGKKLMIAYRLHYEPMNQTVAEMVREKTYGAVKSFASSNCQNVQAPNIRLSKALGGGPLGDIGIYSINTARMILGEEPVEVTAIAEQPREDPRFREVAETVTFTLRFPSGALASCDCSFGSIESRRYRVHCTEGFLEMDPAFSYRGLRMRVKQGTSEKNNTQLTEMRMREVNQFASEMDHFSDCIIADSTPRTPGEEGLADMRVIAALEQAIRTGRSVRVEHRV